MGYKSFSIKSHVLCGLCVGACPELAEGRELIPLAKSK